VSYTGGFLSSGYLNVTSDIGYPGNQLHDSNGNAIEVEKRMRGIEALGC
jgi:hypothetical protein